jgi:hypothetical protein
LLLLWYQIATLTIPININNITTTKRENYAVVANFIKLKEKGEEKKMRGISK